MTYNKILSLVIIGLAITFLAADINVKLNPSNTNSKLPTVKLEGRDYVCVNDMNAVLGSISKHEFRDHRMHFHIYKEQFIFHIHSPYYSFKNEIYNMQYPLLQHAARIYLPATFVLENLPMHFPEEVDLKGKTLHVKKPEDKSIKTIVLDPGHGGKDPGALGKNGTREKDINLVVAFKLKHLLENELGVRVLMTRSDDRFVSLADRTRFANENDADLFISLHTNASKSRAARGLETFYLATSMNSDTRAVEALENKVVDLYEGEEQKQKYDDLAFILSDMLQTENLENSNNLATLIQRNMIAGSQGCDRGVKQANFYVLRGAYMPSILIEMGFISNPDEEVLLINDDYQDRLSRTIFEGIKRYKFRHDRILNA
jgi:N-acetylmuramoyl-L-alanine amidase